MFELRDLQKWLTPGMGIKRWLMLLLAGVFIVAVGISLGVLKTLSISTVDEVLHDIRWFHVAVGIVIGMGLMLIGLMKLSHAMLEPYRRHQRGAIVDVMYAHSKRHKGTKVVAIGGGTGLPSVLRGMKAFTSNITAVVTVADDGGSSGRLRREMGVLPPGDLRNNIAALSDDESLMTQLFQYRFQTGDLDGHAFGNLFISALSGVTGSLEAALIETERVLNIQGRVLPSTLHDVVLVARVRLPGASRSVDIKGESNITAAGGQIEKVELQPPDIDAYEDSIQAILDADIVVIGPGSLYTSILPNLLIGGITEALRATSAYKIYVCNIATQLGETENYTVADHVMALERHIGRGVFQAVVANDAYPEENAGINTHYVQRAPEQHEIYQRYFVYYTDLVDPDRPWRHSPQKLARAILNLSEQEGVSTTAPVFVNA